MKQKQARYIMQAIQSGCRTVNQILDFIKSSDYTGYIYNYHVRDIGNELWKYGYIEKIKIGHNLQYSIIKSVSSQSDIVLHPIVESLQ